MSLHFFTAAIWLAGAALWTFGFIVFTPTSWIGVVMGALSLAMAWVHIRAWLCEVKP